jgi:hypothetical protein
VSESHPQINISEPERQIIGRKFGRLTLIRRLGPAGGRRGGSHDRYCECRCDCGTDVVVLLGNIKSGATKSCGCLRKELVAAFGRSRPRPGKPGTAFRKFLREYKQGAESRKLCFDLSDEQVRALSQLPCFFCGVGPYREVISSAGERFICNGIDRLDPTVGYTVENCVSCCSPCNHMKMTLNYRDFISQCRKIAARFSEGPLP